MNIYSQAACKDLSVDLFCGPSPGVLNPTSRSIALDVCSSCPIKAECLTDALSDGTFDSVRGGVYFDKFGMPGDRSVRVFAPPPRNCELCETPLPTPGPHVTNPRKTCSDRCRKRLAVIKSRAV